GSSGPTGSSSCPSEVPSCIGQPLRQPARTAALAAAAPLGEMSARQPVRFAPTDIIPSKLAWAAEGQTVYAGGPHASYFRLATWEIDAQAFEHGAFRVMHYDRKCLGSAFGPLSLVQAVLFSEERANVAVLLGCYLITREGWTVDQVARALPAEAEVRFPCQWDRACKRQDPVMAVRDCWDGIQLAKNLRWLSSGPGENVHVSLSISQQLRMLAEYDAAWMIPDKVLVMADPMTTIRDPNPTTCSHFSGRPRVEESIWDMEPPVMKRQDATHQRQVTADTCDTSNPDSDSLSAGGALGPPCTGFKLKMIFEKINSGSTTLRDDDHPGENAEDGSSKDSIASVCKRDNRDGLGVSKARSDVVIPDFVTFCHMNRISTIVRTNSGQEEGLVEDGGSYHPSQVYRHGIRHVDMFVNDTKGSLPSVEVIWQFLDLARQMGLLKENADGLSDESPALLVHCKSGFGRSVLLACCLIIFAYDVPGRALLGWARLVRPGAITVREQELFLCGLDGREDLQRMIEEARSMQPPHGELTCQSCCSVQ
ncbi:unnamed protein product, partial [Prorocentrum cordatum]